MTTRASSIPAAFARDVGGVLAAFVVLLAAEQLAVGFGYRAEFVGAWEMGHARTYLSPIALVVAIPAAAVAAALGRLVGARKAGLVALLVAIGAALSSHHLSTGRHFASWAVRGPFVAVAATASGALGFLLARWAGPSPDGARSPRVLAALGAIVAALAWSADAFVLPRLYPAFHAALLALTFLGAAATFLAVRGGRTASVLAAAAWCVAVASAAFAPRAARAVAGDDNLRRILVEHAPVLGRAVVVAARIAPPPALEPEEPPGSTDPAAGHGGGSQARALDWSGRDIVVVTIDALRADHVGAYGYRRLTTPHIDRLAARGTRFERAYCPTPHTSYSVASMMTGKYMRPLLAMGEGDGSDTWATYLRRYGYRTAAFYPPAIFFIDAHRFGAMERSSLGFEYAKVEFAPPDLRKRQLTEYVTHAPRDKPLFLWLHLFEPHEPYVMHPDHAFEGDDPVDAYDSEIATADAMVGALVAVVEKERPGAVFVVSADHGEELGDHGGRYHGTTVYEEQVRVPLVVAGAGVAFQTVETPVQTIDLLPTTLAALDVPRPARVRGRDLGRILAGKGAGSAGSDAEGLAFAETDDYTMVARGDDRLVCVRKIASCTLFDVRKDPGEHHPVRDRPERVEQLRRLGAAIERENGRLEHAAMPEALRRGLQGDRDAAPEVAALLDDARVDIRREAARCAFHLRAPEITAQLRRAFERDEDRAVRDWSALGLTRLGESGLPVEIAAGLLPAEAAASGAMRVAAALVLAERGDGRGEAELVRRIEASGRPLELDEAREILDALVRIRSRASTRVLVAALADVRLRPYVVDALGEIGDPHAKEPLLAAFAEERYLHVRPKEARALVRLGARETLRAPLARFAGVPTPMEGVLDRARDAGVLAPAGWSVDARREGGPEPRDPSAVVAVPGLPRVERDVRLDGVGPARILVDAAVSSPPEVKVDGVKASLARRGDAWVGELPAFAEGARLRVEASHPSGVRAFWVVRRAPEIPPPPPRQWDGGAP